MKKERLKKVWKWFTILLLIYAIIGFAIWFFQDKLIFRPKKLTAGHVYKFDIPFRELNLPMTSEKNLSLVQFTVPDSARKGIVLYFHGNRGNIERYAPFAKDFTRNAYEVWMMDYPGYGKSTGKRTEQGFYDDALTLYKMAMKNVSAEQIIIYGKSLGTGIAAQLASVRDCKRLILETPYCDFPSVIGRYLPIYPMKWMLKYQLPTAQYLENVSAPVGIFHGTRDGVVAYRHSKRLQKQFKPGDELVTIKGGGHNDLFSYPEAINKLDSLLKLP